MYSLLKLDRSVLGSASLVKLERCALGGVLFTEIFDHSALGSVFVY